MDKGKKSVLGVRIVRGRGCVDAMSALSSRSHSPYGSTEEGVSLASWPPLLPRLAPFFRSFVSMFLLPRMYVIWEMGGQTCIPIGCGGLCKGACRI